jgi:hypothetical protein
MKVSTETQKLLGQVVTTNLAYRTAKDLLEAQMRVELESKLLELLNSRNKAVKDADAAGIPRTHIGKAIGTTNYRTVQEILDMQPSAYRNLSTQSYGQQWAIKDLEDGKYNLSIANLGDAGMNGVAVVKFDFEGEEIFFVEGEEFVIGAIYRNGLAEDVLASVR